VFLNAALLHRTAKTDESPSFWHHLETICKSTIFFATLKQKSLVATKIVLYFANPKKKIKFANVFETAETASVFSVTSRKQQRIQIINY